MEIKITEMPSQSILEEYLAGAKDEKSVEFNRKKGVFEKVSERPLYHKSDDFLSVNGWASLPDIKQMPSQEILERYLKREKIAFYPSIGRFDSY